MKYLCKNDFSIHNYCLDGIFHLRKGDILNLENCSEFSDNQLWGELSDSEFYYKNIYKISKQIFEENLFTLSEWREIQIDEILNGDECS